MTKKLETAIAYLQDDAFAASFQSLGQYRQAILKAITNTQENEAHPSTVEPPAKSERHLAQRGAALFNAFECLSNVRTHYSDWSIGFSELANAAAAQNDESKTSFWRHQVVALDELKKHAESALATGMFCLDPESVPNGSWLWVKLMDWCKAEQVAPGNYNSLFAICGEAYQLAADGERTVSNRFVTTD